MLKVYIALEYAPGIYGKGQSTGFLWSKIYDPTIFKDTMSRFAYKETRKFLRFDIKSTRKFSALRYQEQTIKSHLE